MGNMEKEMINLLTDLHINNNRQGPGSDEAFVRALELSDIDRDASLQIADVGCGTGVVSMLLTQATAANITAVDLLPEFIQKLEECAKEKGVADHIKTLVADMEELPFQEGQFDVIWSEGAIYNIGFSRGIESWKKYIKIGGILVVTEITWLVPDIPKELWKYWESKYPEIAYASSKIKQLEGSGYMPIGYFPLSQDCWLKEYYDVLEAGFSDFLKRNKNSEKAIAIVDAEKKEIELYKKYKEYYSYGCYIAKRIT